MLPSGNYAAGANRGLSQSAVWPLERMPMRQINTHVAAALGDSRAHQSVGWAYSVHLGGLFVRSEAKQRIRFGDELERISDHLTALRNGPARLLIGTSHAREHESVGAKIRLQRLKLRKQTGDLNSHCRTQSLAGARQRNTGGD